MHGLKKALRLASLIAFLVAVGVPQPAEAQTCALCKKNSKDECNLPTIDNDCGCCPGGGET